MTNSNTKIAFFLPSLEGGGAERVCVNLIREFNRRHINVELVLSKAKGPYLASVPKEVKVIDLNAPSVSKSLPGLISYLRSERPVALISSLNHANVVAIIAAKIARSKTKVIVREDNVPSLSASRAQSLKARYMPLVIRVFYRYADFVIAVSEGVRDDLVTNVKIPAEKVRVIYNPVITPELPSDATEPVTHEWFSNCKIPVIISVGRLTKQKDFETLLKAFALVRKEVDARLVILGEGEEREKLESLARDLGIFDDIWMPGFVDNPYKFISKASVFVLSSIYEGLSNVLVEALACKTPVISTDCRSGPAEILANGKFGKLVPVGDVNALKDSIINIISYSQVAQDNGTLLEHLKKFEVGNVAEMYLNLINTAGG